MFDISVPKGGMIHSYTIFFYNGAIHKYKHIYYRFSYCAHGYKYDVCVCIIACEITQIYYIYTTCMHAIVYFYRHAHKLAIRCWVNHLRIRHALFLCIFCRMYWNLSMKMGILCCSHIAIYEIRRFVPLVHTILEKW